MIAVGDIVTVQLWSPIHPEWDSTLAERQEHGHHYGVARVMRVAGITEHVNSAEYRQSLGAEIPSTDVTRYWLVDPARPRDESLMSWCESDWAELTPYVEDGALF